MGSSYPRLVPRFYDIAFYTFYFTGIAFRLFCMPNGLAVAHFNWSLAAAPACCGVKF